MLKQISLVHKTLYKCAIDCNVSKVIALSTDKAVNPINLYGQVN